MKKDNPQTMERRLITTLVTFSKNFNKNIFSSLYFLAENVVYKFLWNKVYSMLCVNK